ncbi:serpin B6-like isoform X2 [Biomphalaria glabrata]|uniref:Serpin B6-like isoform X2 n=1 Tax=Biomphalaria glabrata TaxID=6526 RepID=A0A9W2YFH1_BIOGL|nr:serpin B6-like isoform X2 [Biomphalaria glabrata]
MYILCTMILLSITLVVFGQLVSADQQQQLALSSASSDFSQRLYQKVALDRSNVVYSPYSIHSLLTMTSLGARGDTATEMKDVLGITSLGDSVHSIYRETIQQLNSQSNVQLLTGNAIFINPSYPIVPEFIQETSDKYLAKADNIDLDANGGPEEPINDYIENKTEHVIKDLLEPGSIDDLTVMLLVNTLFFNGTWASPFAKSQTRKQDFKLLGGTVKQLDMMHGSERRTFMKKDDVNNVDVAEIPFRGRRFALYIALPRACDGITDLENLLQQPGKVDELFTGLQFNTVEMTIPKFRVETKLDLEDVLFDMGMVKALSEVQADLSGISQGVYISRVIHQAVIDVQESGTVAAAVTVGEMSFFSIPVIVPFIADHPFLYFLRDKETGQILFQGKFSG